GCSADLVLRAVAVGAPVALHLSSVGVEHRHAAVAVAVGDERLVRLRVDEDLRHPAEVLQVVAALVVAEAAELEQELAVLGELEDMRVLLAVAADPDVALVVDEDAVVRLGPLVALPWPAPVPQQIARLVELEHRRRAAAAFAGRRIDLGAALVGVQRRRAAVDDPDMVLVIDPHADGHAKQPVVRQRLRPERIDFERRRADELALVRLVRLLLEKALRAAEQHEKADENAAQDPAVAHCPSSTSDVFSICKICNTGRAWLEPPPFLSSSSS